MILPLLPGVMHNPFSDDNLSIPMPNCHREPVLETKQA